MKLLLKFFTKNNKLPLDYRRVFLSFLKKALSEIANGKYYERYYFSPERRPFTFALKLPNPIFSSGEITIGKNEFSLTFSTGDSTAGFVFMSAFIAQKGKTFPAPFHNAYVLTDIMKISEPKVTSDSATVKMLSPLCLREHDKEHNKDIYYSSANKCFSEKATQILSQQLILAGFSEDMVQSVQLIPVNCKKTVVKHYGCAIECTVGKLVINADKSVINYFLQYGIGSRKSAGFGLAELIAEGD
ncbi:MULTISPECIES: CRISPR-associated endoribonuclease Cas6 [unclassified Ruminococcus]|uniref:CRISPR-associated endoribonuclease Cas6 n=1 Tax=unclassified Ruminococcus TaxID=2608920 RepID=UPI00210BE525|nr:MULTISPECIES: CRISPR-associated endoribonuclease Cas6 [unclassified Ruminococcus]MCQ4023330.1 CRISPR-associated endoribonuclease Cas6 [Ruminococcus sp. zg-924]MCQ4115697.1 CRISPR-associated endoribonuclease Cas6 [Ruminococcus sp. zg-921]